MNRRHIRRMALLLALLFLLTAALTTAAQAASLRRGARGDDVVTLQKKLKNWGYYSGAVDGVFGGQTEQAVIYFQRRNGLTPDGVVGEQTARALGMRLSGSSSSQSSAGTGASSGDVYLLARCIYGEARGEPYKGQVAVGAVILNRVRSSSFPNSIAGVIYQSGAFSVVSDGQINLSPDSTALKAAQDAMNGWYPTGGCLYYYNPDKTTNQWMRSRPIVTTIGEHVFCK